LGSQLTKAEKHMTATGGDEAALLGARLDGSENEGHPRDLHMYTLAAHVHWAAEGAKLAIAHLLGTPFPPNTNVGLSFAALHQHLDRAIAEFRTVAPGDLGAGLNREITIENPRGSVRFSGSQFLLEFAIPHFYYHLTSAYGILRNHGVPLTMSDFLGNVGTGATSAGS
jgi:hypothetical protein